MPQPSTGRLTNLDQPFVSTIGIAWTAYLSLTNAAEDTDLNREPRESSELRLP